MKAKSLFFRCVSPGARAALKKVESTPIKDLHIQDISDLKKCFVTPADYLLVAAAAAGPAYVAYKIFNSESEEEANSVQRLN